MDPVERFEEEEEEEEEEESGIPEESLAQLRELNAHFTLARQRLERNDTAVRNSTSIQFALNRANQAVAKLEVDSKLEALDEAKNAMEELAQVTEQEEITYTRIKEGQTEVIDSEGEVPSVSFRPKPKTVVKARAGATPGDNGGDYCELTMMDCLYGETATIDGLWVYEHPIDPDMLMEGLERLLTEIPMLAGRIEPDEHRVRLSNEGVPVTVQYATGSLRALPRDPQPRKKWIDMRPLDDIWNGKEPIMTVCLTQLLDGSGSVLGIQVSHGVAGGNGFFGYVLPRFAAFTREAYGMELKHGDLGTTPVIQGRDALPRSRRTLEETKAAIKEQEYQPMSFREPIIGPIKRAAMYLSLKSAQGRPRVVEHYDRDELEAIKAAAFKDVKSAKYLSTGEALASFIARIMSTLAPAAPGRPTQITMIVEHAGRVKDLPDGLMANSFYLYSCEFKKKWIHQHTLSEIADILHDRLLEILGDEHAMYEHMVLQEDYLTHNFQPNPYLTLKLPLVYNNQSKFLPLIQLDFGTGKPIHYVPHQAGDSILMVPDPDGGINVWMSTVNFAVGDPRNLAQPEYQAKLHQFRDPSKPVTWVKDSVLQLDNNEE